MNNGCFFTHDRATYDITAIECSSNYKSAISADTDIRIMVETSVPRPAPGCLGVSPCSSGNVCLVCGIRLHSARCDHDKIMRSMII